ncbi:thiamine biosynthesis protein ThiS [Candidatus Woesearchaeota archaeon CG10_big_fil_rev_8_21_14_0_10_45_16]|nr:MAG: thiamine biosynthesis protein ThiS [Candidatus Woesearchaeota archaeon CG10_big_fil_rev_8_21_14_0_10_45_16]
MNITVHFEKEQTTKDILLTGTSVNDLLEQLKINPETVLVVRNKEVITEDEILSENDNLQILSVISGG